MPHHTWTKDDWRFLFGICEMYESKKTRLQMLVTMDRFHDCTKGALHYAIMRWQKRKDNQLDWDPANGITSGYGSNVSRTFLQAWSEWRK